MARVALRWRSGQNRGGQGSQEERRTDPFEKFVEAANQLVAGGRSSWSSWPFSCCGRSATRSGRARRSGFALHTGSSILSLLLLALLENAGRRSQEAIQEKPNVIAEALLWT